MIATLGTFVRSTKVLSKVLSTKVLSYLRTVVLPEVFYVVLSTKVQLHVYNYCTFVLSYLRNNFIFEGTEVQLHVQRTCSIIFEGTVHVRVISYEGTKVPS